MNMQNEAIKKAIKILGSQSKLGEATNTRQSSVWKWLHYKSKVKPEKVPLIVEATNGEVKACDIRPDLPHLFPPK